MREMISRKGEVRRVVTRALGVVLITSVVFSGCSGIRSAVGGVTKASTNQNAAQKSGEERALLSHSVATKPLKIDLFAARGFLEGSDYERYVLKGGTLWRECGGVLQRNKRGGVNRRAGEAKAFKEDPNLVPVETHVESLSQEQFDAVLALAEDIIAIPDKQRLNSPLPGSVFSLTQPGIFELGVTSGAGDKAQTTRLVTSVDAVADREAHRVAMDRAYRLFRSLRSVGPVMCKSKTFFGVGRDVVGRE